MGTNDLKNIAKNGNNVKIKIYNEDDCFYSTFGIYKINSNEIFYKAIQENKGFDEALKQELEFFNIIEKVAN